MYKKHFPAVLPSLTILFVVLDIYNVLKLVQEPLKKADTRCNITLLKLLVWYPLQKNLIYITLPITLYTFCDVQKRGSSGNIPRTDIVGVWTNNGKI